MAGRMRGYLWEDVLKDRYKTGDWEKQEEPGWNASVYVAGNYNTSEMVLRDICFPSGLCVTIEKVKYIFGGGAEDGVRVGLIQYPKFPESIENLMGKAELIGKKLCEANYQFSFSIVSNSKNVYYSRRK